MRQIVLDTETTGLDPAQGHRIIEIGCVELINRQLTGNNYHQYINPCREIEDAAIDVHGITNEFLVDKPQFQEIANDFESYVNGAELIIHNAPFDCGFINAELALVASSKKAASKIEKICTITDTLKMARQLHPGQRNNLDALCKRYEVDNSQRTFHGALLDAEILADVYLRITGGQIGFFEDSAKQAKQHGVSASVRWVKDNRKPLPVIRPTKEELVLHNAWVEELDKNAGGESLWHKLK